MVRVLTLYLHRALANDARGRRFNSDASSYTNKHYRVLQQNSSAYDVIAVVDAGSAADPGGHWPRSRAEPHVDPGHAHAVWSGRQLSFFLCQHVLITNINCSRYSRPFEPIQNMQMTYWRVSSKCPTAHSLQLYCTVSHVSLSLILPRF